MRASVLVEPTSHIYLVGYEPSPGVADDDFLHAWRAAVAGAPPSAGVLHRELCRQIAAWNEKIAAEIQHPNPFAFIDYAVLLPDQDPAALPGLPEEVAAKYRRTEGAFRVDARFARAEAAGEPEVVLFNVFELTGSPEAGERFAMNWPPRGEYQSRQAGFYSAILHRPVKGGGRVLAFNRAEWESVDHYAATLPGFERTFPRSARAGGPGVGPPPVQSFLGLFRAVATVAR